MGFETGKKKRPSLVSNISCARRIISWVVERNTRIIGNRCIHRDVGIQKREKTLTGTWWKVREVSPFIATEWLTS